MSLTPLSPSRHRAPYALLSLLLLLVAAAIAPRSAAAQARSGAERDLQLSAFGMLAGRYTGLSDTGSSGRNLTFAAGADLGFYTFHTYTVSAEVRGAVALDGGSVDAQKEIQGGVRIHRRYNRFLPYGDVLFGRGAIDYKNGGYVYDQYRYLYSASNVYGLGGGVEYDITPRFAVKVDAQFNHWSVPVTPSGSIWSKQGALGVTYRYGTGAPKLGTH